MDEAPVGLSPERGLWLELERFVESRHAELDLSGDLTMTIKGGNTLTIPLVMLADAP